MQKAIVLTIVFILLLTPMIAKAQPEPPNVPTLGPALINSKGDNFSNVTIYSPQNQNYLTNQNELLFSVVSVRMFGQFGNVGYSLDNGPILSVNSFLNKTFSNESLPAWYYSRTTVYAKTDLTNLSKGTHNVTVYYGWQYLGIPENPSLERFEVSAYDSVKFTISDSNTPASSPSPTIPEYPLTAILMLWFLAASTALILKNKKQTLKGVGSNG